MHTHPDRLRLCLRWSRTLARLGLVLGGACLLGACAARLPRPVAPAKTLARYRAALERDDPKAAYALLTPAAQQALPYEQFAKEWQDTAVERGAQAAALRQILLHGLARSGPQPPREPQPGPASAPPGPPFLRARAVVTLPQGAQLILEPTGAERVFSGKPSAWRILDPDLQVVRAPTPEAALRLLLAAADQRNYPALLRLLTKAERESLEAELAERIERLRTSLFHSPPIEPTGDRARVQYDPRFFIDLRHEPDGWRIADFN